MDELENFPNFPDVSNYLMLSKGKCSKGRSNYLSNYSPALKKGRARKLYTSARIYEWKFGKGEWKLPFASPTGRADIFGFVIIFEEKKELTSMFYSRKNNANTVKKDCSVGFKCH